MACTKMMATLYNVETNTINYHNKRFLVIVNYRRIQLFENIE